MIPAGYEDPSTWFSASATSGMIKVWSACKRSEREKAHLLQQRQFAS